MSVAAQVHYHPSGTPARSSIAAAMDLQALYDSCLSEGSGSFGLPELRAAMSQLGSEELPEDSLRQMLKHLDRDGDGVVSKEDFCHALSNFLAEQQQQHQDAPASMMLASDFVPDDSDHEMLSPDSSMIMARDVPDDEPTTPLRSDSRTNIFRLALNELSTAYNIRPADLDPVWQALEATLSQRCAALRDRERAVARRCKQLEQVNEMLTKEVEQTAEAAGDSADVQCKLKSLQAENARLTTELADTRDELAYASSTIKSHSNDQAKALAEFNELQKRVKTLESQLRTAELDRDFAATQHKELMLERDAAFGDIDNLRQVLHERERMVLTLETDIAERQHEITELEEELALARQTIEHKDKQLSELTDKVFELQATLENMESRGHQSSTSSILNEIEELVAEQVKAHNSSAQGGVFDLLRGMVISHNSPDDCSDSDTGTSPSQASDIALMQALSSRKLVRRLSGDESSPGGSGHDSPSSDLPSGTDVEDDGVSPMLLVRQRLRKSSVVSPRSDLGTDIDSDHESARFSFSATSSAQSSNMSLTGQAHQPSSLSGLRVGNKTVVVDRDAEKKKGQIFRLYAASTQHLAGMKIATKESIKHLSAQELLELKETLEALVEAKNRMLVKTLAEREMLTNEIHLKRNVIIPVLDLAMIGQPLAPTTPATEESPKTAPTTTHRASRRKSRRSSRLIEGMKFWA